MKIEIDTTQKRIIFRDIVDMKLYTEEFYVFFTNPIYINCEIWTYKNENPQITKIN